MTTDRINRLEREVMDAIAVGSGRLTQTAIAWSKINSGSLNLAGLERMADAIVPLLEPLGGRLERLEPAPAEAVDGEGRLTALTRGRNLRLTLRPDAPIQVLLAGHMDTVFPPDHPFQDVRETSAGVFCGPGLADMKGGLVVMIAALTAFEASSNAEHLGFQLVINADEEVSSLGSGPLLSQSASRAHLGLVYEPASTPEGVLAGARKGLASFTLVARGRAAHAGRNPQDGRNAMVAAADFALQAASLTGAREGLTINVARIEGGGPTNVVPDLALCRLEARVASHEDRRWIETQLAQRARAIGAARDVTLELHGRFTRPPKPLDPATAALFEAVRRCGADLGQPIDWKPSGGCCDGNNLAERGLPVVDTLGVRGGAIHSSDEFMIADSLVERAQLSALLLLRLSSGAVTIAQAQRNSGRAP